MMFPTTSADASSNWTTQETPKIVAGFAAVYCVASNRCELVGSRRSGPLAEGWDGTIWSVQPVPSTPGGALYSVSCVGTKFCEAVGNQNGSMLAEGWNGHKWSIQPVSPASSGEVSVSCVSTDFCEAVGGLAEGWNGSTWTVQNVPAPADASGPAGLSGVSCTPNGTCEGVGSYDSNTTGTNVTLAELWNGTAWSVQPTPVLGSFVTGNLFNAVSCSAPNYCEAVGRYANGYGTPVNLTEVWNGTSWTKQPVPKPSRYYASYLVGVSCEAPDACEAIGTFLYGANPAFAYAWNGTTWSTDTPPQLVGLPYGSDLSGISCYGPGSCEAVGDVGGATTSSAVALIRT
jgi:hypothetical protein